MKKALALIIFTATLFGMVGCGQAKKNETKTTEIVTEVATETTEETMEPVAINMGDLINEMADGKPVVTIMADGEDICSFDFSKMKTEKVEITIHTEDDSLYVMMAGNVTAHTLESDGSLFDGIAEIENGKAEFSVTYDDTTEILFVLHVN